MVFLLGKSLSVPVACPRHSPPSGDAKVLVMARATALRVKGDVTFEPGVVVVGEVTLATDEPRTIPAGTTVDESWQ